MVLDVLTNIFYGLPGRSVGGFQVREIEQFDGNTLHSVRYRRTSLQGGSVRKSGVRKVQILVKR